MKYDELSKEAQTKAREWISDTQCDDGWYEDVYEDARTCLGYLGFSDIDIAFSGFGSQGDGANFTGNWVADKVDMAGLQGHASRDETLHQLCGRLVAVYLRFPDMQGTMARRGREHSGVMYLNDVTISDDDEGSALLDSQELRDDEDEVQSVARLCADWIYKQLEAEYEYQHEESALVAAAEGYDYDEDGSPL